MCVCDWDNKYGAKSTLSCQHNLTLHRLSKTATRRLRIQVLRISKVPKINDFFASFKTVKFKIYEIQIITFIAVNF